MTSRIIECSLDTTQRTECYSRAMRELSGNAIRLFSYLWNMAELEGGKSIFQLYAGDVCTYTGMGGSSYYAAIHELTDKGYITPKTGKRQYFLFDGNGA